LRIRGDLRVYPPCSVLFILVPLMVSSVLQGRDNNNFDSLSYFPLFFLFIFFFFLCFSLWSSNASSSLFTWASAVVLWCYLPRLFVSYSGGLFFSWIRLPLKNPTCLKMNEYKKYQASSLDLWNITLHERRVI
jgi:hypothetical protein